MLDLAAIDLATLCHALEDHSPGACWWLDPATGRLSWHETWANDQDGAPREAGLLEVEPIPPAQTRADMQEFVERVRDPDARVRLQAALEGRGAFARFKDALLQVPELRRAWLAFHELRVQRRAIGWLAARDLVDRSAADAALAARPEPHLPGVAAPQPVAGASGRALLTDALLRAREEIHAARLLAGHGFGTQAIVCAGTAARFAAAAALLAAGVPLSSADEAEQRFGELVGSGHAFAPATGELFVTVVARARAAGYAWGGVDRGMVDDAIRDASSVVDAAAAWVSARSAASKPAS